MKIKVQCACETRFEFEVEPVNGRMPVPINCPSCGVDATGLANEIIKQQQPVPVRPAVAVPAAASPPAPASPPPPAPAASGLRIAKSAAAHSPPAPAAAAPAATATEAPAASHCARHQSEPVTETCRVCGKPICLKCMEQFGFVCSVYCRGQANQRHLDIPVYRSQKSVVEEKSRGIARLVSLAVAVVVAALISFWFWYAWFARNPKVVYSLAITSLELDPKKAPPPDQYYQLIAPNELLSIKDKRLTLLDVTQQKPFWSVPLAVPEEDFFLEPQVTATTNDVWISFPGQLARFDRRTGASRELSLKGKILSVTPGDNAFLVISENPGEGRLLTRITLPDGAAQSEEVDPPVKTEVVATTGKTSAHAAKAADTNGKIPVDKLRIIAAQASAQGAGDDEHGEFFPGNDTPEFTAAGPNVVQLKTKLLEHKTVEHAAMKAKGKSVLESQNLTASQGLEVAQEMMNDAQRERTGGVTHEDVSRYQVTLHRRFGGNIPDWTGEVSGPPRFFSLKTVDVVATSSAIYVFDKNNKKLWDAKLAYPPRSSEEGGAPCLETRDALYFADQGVMARYDLAGGAVRWRLNSVGISHIQADGRSKLYLDTTTAGPESIQYSQQINLGAKVHPVILKVDPETGKILWRVESVGAECLLSGKFVYATRVSSSYAALRLEEGPDIHFNLNLLDPANGKVIWNYYQGNRRIVKTEVQKNWILLHFQDGVVVLKFFSL